MKSDPGIKILICTYFCVIVVCFVIVRPWTSSFLNMQSCNETIHSISELGNTEALVVEVKPSLLCNQMSDNVELYIK